MFEGFTLDQGAWLAGAIAVRVLWQGAIIGLVAAVVLALLRNAPPAARYAAGCVALVAFALLIPSNVAFAPELPAPPLAPTDVPVPFRYSAAYSGEASTPSTSPATQIGEAPIPTPAAAPLPQWRDPRPRPVIAAWYEAALPWIGGFWAVGVILFALHDIVGLLAVARLRGRGEDAPTKLLAMADRVRQRIGVQATVPIRVVEGISTAMVTGLFRVIILVPTSMVSWMTPEAVEAILAHEFAHLRRWDRWVNLLQCILETVLFFHPALWWLSRRLRTERELCCDELALSVCPDPGLYVRALLTLAQAPAHMPTAVLSSHGGKFSHRVRHILGLPRPPAYTKRQAGAASALVVAGGIAPLLVWSCVGSAAEHGAELRFSDLKAIGVVQARWEDDPRPTGDPWLTEYSAGWTVLEEAKGLVTIPKGAQVKLTIAKTELSALYSLPPDAVYFLDARWRDLTDRDIAPIAHLTGLRALDLSENRLNMHGPGLAALGTLKNLEWLNLWFTPVETLPENGIRQFPRLRFLSGHFRHNSAAVMRQCADLKELEFVSFRSGPSITAKDVAHLSNKSSLHGLVLYNMEMTDETFAGLQNLPNLRYLGVGRNQVTDLTMAAIAKMRELRYLDLHQTALTDAGLALLATLPHLKTINLAYTGVTDAGLESLESMPSLYDANLVGTGVTDAQAAAFIDTIAYRGLKDAPVQSSSNPDAPRVGLVISHYTCTGPTCNDLNRIHEVGAHFNYGIQDSAPLAAALNEANFDVYAVVEPGTQHLGEIPGILRAHGLATKVIEVTDEAAMLKLDAVITCSLYNALPEMLLGLRDAVEAGVGLVTIGALGDNVPGAPDPLVTVLTGVDGAVYTDLGCQAGNITVLQAHPLLGNQLPGAVYPMLTLIGSASRAGVESGIVLIQGPPEYGEGFPALYVRDLGEGRIVRAQWHHSMQPGLPFPGYTFCVRALNWAAHRDADAIW
jgi:beta-lactamase regulating signal transducer with metallopeptidase domain